MSRKQQLNSNEQTLSRITNFVFPGLGVKTFYESTHKKLDANNKLSKKANLYAMIKVESFVMPQNMMMINRDLFTNTRDMVISPALLDFLEQALEPFELATPATKSDLLNKPSFYDEEKDSNKNRIRKQKSDADEKNLQLQQQSLPHQQQASYFPIDVVVFISMLPSSIRFTCQPLSTMECLLKLPSVEMVFSTNRVDEQTQSRLATLLNSETFNGETNFCLILKS